MVTFHSEEVLHFNVNKFSTIVLRKAIVYDIDGKKKLNLLEWNFDMGNYFSIW